MVDSQAHGLKYIAENVTRFFITMKYDDMQFQVQTHRICINSIYRQTFNISAQNTQNLVVSRLLL